MGYKEFLIPPEDRFEAVLGVSVEPVDEIGVRSLSLKSDDGFDVSLTFSSLGRSVTLVIQSDGRQIFRIEREGAIELQLADVAPQLSATFSTDDTKGRLEISISPMLNVRESILLA